MISFHEALVLFTILSLLNVIPSLITVWITFDMKLRMNPYLKMILTISFSQGIYNCSCWFVVFKPNWLYQLLFCIRYSASVVTTILINVFILSVTYLVLKQKKFDLGEAFNKILLGVFLISVPIGIVAASFRQKTGEKEETFFQIYGSLYLFSIAISIFAVCTIVLPLFLRTSVQSSKVACMIELSKRLIYYPIVQLFTYIWLALYHIVYKKSIYEYQDSTSPSKFQKLLYLLSCIVTPMAGLGYCCVFLAVQRGAYQHLKKKCCLLFSSMKSSTTTLNDSLLERYEQTNRDMETIDHHRPNRFTICTNKTNSKKIDIRDSDNKSIMYLLDEDDLVDRITKTQNNNSLTEDIRDVLSESYFTRMTMSDNSINEDYLVVKALNSPLTSPKRVSV